MKDESGHSFLGGFPRKTAWAALWFALLGATAFLWHHKDGGYLTGEDGLSLVQPGPLPVATSALPEQVQTFMPLQSEQSAFDPSPLGGGAPRNPHQPIEDPDDAAMCRFYRAVELLDTEQERSPVRILHYGDSILTTDELSGQVRRILQKQFGDGGHGFVLLGKPWSWYHHRDVEHGARGNWRVRPVTSDPVSDGMYGLGGVAFETREPNSTAWAGTVDDGPIGTRVASFDVSYLGQPHGGSLDLMIDGRVVETISTSSSKRDIEHHELKVHPGQAKLVVKTRGDGPVRLFGAVLESGQPGIVYDSLAINGARASIFTQFDIDHWKSELNRRNANLVVLMFGANEGHNEFLPLKEYKAEFSGILKTIRKSAPEAACLVVGPLDQAERTEDGKLGSRRMPSKLSKAQREVSLAQGCAFFDTLGAMGGENSMAKWLKTGLGGGDLIHPTEQGARRIGTWLADALLAGYEKYLYGGKLCASTVTSL